MRYLPILLILLLVATPAAAQTNTPTPTPVPWATPTPLAAPPTPPFQVMPPDNFDTIATIAERTVQIWGMMRSAGYTTWLYRFLFVLITMGVISFLMTGGTLKFVRQEIDVRRGRYTGTRRRLSEYRTDARKAREERRNTRGALRYWR